MILDVCTFEVVPAILAIFIEGELVIAGVHVVTAEGKFFYWSVPVVLFCKITCDSVSVAVLDNLCFFVSHIEVKKGVHPLLDEEAVRVASLMPKWMPGKQMGTAVRVNFTLPVFFSLK